MRRLYVLIACEESQEICKAFRNLGHIAFSCDLQDCSGGHPEWHLKGNCFEFIDMYEWDLIIAHPPCTRLCNSGQRWLYYGSEEYRNKKLQEQKEAIDFFMKFTKLECKHVAIENPMGIMSTLYRKPDCIYNPYDFYPEVEQKKTCLWLKNLPPLTPNQKIDKNNIKMSVWKGNFNGKNIAWNSPECAKMRSKTLTGVANAIAEQWSKYILESEDK